MALFGKKKDEDGGAKEPAKAPKDGPPPSHPEKAKRFFEHARTVQQSGQYEYAMQNWLGGLRQDAASMEGLEGFWSAATAFVGEGSKLSRDTAKAFSDKGMLEKYLSALLAWGIKPMDASNAIRAAELGAKLGIAEPTFWIGERALILTMRDPKKSKKDSFLKLMDAFAAIGAFEKAAEAGDLAVKSDPGDSELATRVRNFTAQATISGGGFDQTGEAGGFRANLKDADQQRLLEEKNRIVTTEEQLDRLVAASEAALAERPDDLPTLSELVKHLKKRAAPGDEKRALELLAQAYANTRQFRFRDESDKIRLGVAKRQLSALKKAAEGQPAESEAAQRYQKGLRQFAQMEIKALQARIEAYPTDLGLKYELGKRHFDLGEHEKAVEMLQEAKGDTKNRSAAMLYLGESFRAMGWADESIETLRSALDQHEDTGNEIGMGLRYSLMSSLEAKARADRDLEAAKEADKLASAIAIQQINYRDIRERRAAIKELINELRDA